MNDSESGYRVFVRTISGLVFTVTFLWAASYLFVATVAHSNIGDMWGDRPLLHFWLLALTAFYSLVAFCVGQFLWPLGPKPSIARLLIVVSVAALVLALLSPLIRKVWLESTNENSEATVCHPAQESILNFDAGGYK